MKTTSRLFSGIAGLAVAAVLVFGAQAGAASRPTRLALSLPSQMMSSGNAREPAARHVALRHRYYVRAASSDSTPAEQDATDRLNVQQLKAVKN